MSLVDTTPPPAEDETMDPATKQYVDSSLAVNKAQADTRLGEFRAAIEAYTARADEREAAAREREDIRAKAFEQRMDDFMALSHERHNATLARFDRLEGAIAGMKKFVVGASLSTVLGVGGIYAILIQNYHAAFDSARELTTAERGIAAQRQRTEALLSTIEARLAAMKKTGGQTDSSP